MSSLPILFHPLMAENKCQLLYRNQGAKAALTAQRMDTSLCFVLLSSNPSHFPSLYFLKFPQISQQPKLSQLISYNNTTRDVIKWPNQEKLDYVIFSD